MAMSGLMLHYCNSLLTCFLCAFSLCSFQGLNYVGWVGILALIYFAILPVFGSAAVSSAVALAVWAFLVWL